MDVVMVVVLMGFQIIFSHNRMVSFGTSSSSRSALLAHRQKMSTEKEIQYCGPGICSW